MFFKKYKLLKNNGLLPKIDAPKSQNFLTSYCLLNDQKQRQHTILRNPSDKNMLIMFNEKEYLHRRCSYITNQKNSLKVLNQVAALYPRHTHTLAMFIANAPGQCDEVLLGNQPKQTEGKQQNSLLALAYKNIIANKSQQSTVRLSILGIQNENSLTDELNLEWLDQHQDQEKSTPLEYVIKSKQKVRVLKESESCKYFTENLTHHEIKSEHKLRETLQKYRDVKNHLQDWIISTQSAQFYLMGEVYHLAQIKPASEDTPQTVLQSHYMLRINQYFRMASPLMLRLGIYLRKAQEEHSKPMEMHESKLFKLLSECFSGTPAKNQRNYRFHLFLQVGEYPTLKDQYLCLVPTAKELQPNKASTLNNILQSEFFYTKQTMEYPELQAMITNLIQNEKTNKNQSLLPQISGILKARLKTKSYVCDTHCSQEKRIGKFRHLATEESNDRSQMDLEELVYEAAKIYRLPSPKRIPTIVIKQNPAILHRARKNASLFEKSSESVNKEKETNFQKRRKESNLQSSKRDLPRKRFYQETKEWLGLIYGKNSSKRLQSNKRIQKFDETTNGLIRDMLSKQINYTGNEEIQEVIDRL